MQIPQQLSDNYFSGLFHRLMAIDGRFVVNYGGTAAGKSFCAAQKEILWAAAFPVNTLVIRKVGATLRDSVIPAFRNRIAEMGLADRVVYNKTDRMLTFTTTGSQIIFRGLDDPEKLKSFEGLTRILVEEAAELSFEDFAELNRRARGREHIQVTLTFNPIDRRHWLKRHFFDGDFTAAEVIHSTYKDNDFLTGQDRQQIEQMRLYDNNQYRVYALGEWGALHNDSPWLFAFDKQRHTEQQLPILPSYPVYLSFDFNRDPMTCIAVQMSPHRGAHDSFIHIVREFSGRITLREICSHILATFGRATYFVTGDASGSRGDVSMEDRHGTYYKAIQNYLGISAGQLHLHRRNMEHNDSRMLLNTIFNAYPGLRISLDGCPLLVNDCLIARTDDNSPRPGVLKKDRDMYKMDLFDCMRYFFQQYFSDYAGIAPMGKRVA